MEYIFIWAPLLFGAMIGWMVVFFIRQYPSFNFKSLQKTAMVFIGGTGFCSLTFFEGSDVGIKAILYYLLGCAIGFFLYWIYLFIIAFCFRNKFGRSWETYLLFASCNINISSERKREIGIIGYKAEKLTACFKYLLDNKITEEDFKNYIKSSDISSSEYEDMCQIGDEYFMLSPDIIVYIDVKDLKKYFK